MVAGPLTYRLKPIVFDRIDPCGEFYLYVRRHRAEIFLDRIEDDELLDRDTSYLFKEYKSTSQLVPW